jgi:hypothetical protein
MIRSLGCTLISRHLTRSCCEIVVGPVWECRVKAGVVISSLDGSAAVAFGLWPLASPDIASESKSWSSTPIASYLCYYEILYSLA